MASIIERMKNEDPDRDLLIPDEVLDAMRHPTTRDIAILGCCTLDEADQAAEAAGVEPIATLKLYHRDDLALLSVTARDLFGERDRA